MKKLYQPGAGRCTPGILEDVLLLVGVVPRTKAVNMTQRQLDIAYDYAIRMHLRASDNTRVRLQRKPDFL